MHVLGVLLVAEHVQRKPQHGLVVTPHQRVECSAVAALRLADEVVVFAALQGARFQLRLGQLAAVPVGLRSELRRLRHRWGRFYRPRASCAHAGGCIQQRGEAQRRAVRVRASCAAAANHRRKHRRNPAAAFQSHRICIHRR
jgi:hypothetical protein